MAFQLIHVYGAIKQVDDLYAASFAEQWLVRRIGFPVQSLEIFMTDWVATIGGLEQ